MHMKRIWIWIAGCALAIGLAATPQRAVAEPALAGGGGPNCANMIAQASGAVAGLIAQSTRLYQVCSDQGWNSGACIAQGIVVAQAVVWAWWTVSQVYCQCYEGANETYCQAIGILPKPPNPGGGGPAMPAPGPPPPPPMKPVCGPVNDALTPPSSAL